MKIVKVRKLKKGDRFRLSPGGVIWKVFRDHSDWGPVKASSPRNSTKIFHLESMGDDVYLVPEDEEDQLRKELKFKQDAHWRKVHLSNMWQKIDRMLRLWAQEDLAKAVEAGERMGPLLGGGKTRILRELEDWGGPMTARDLYDEIGDYGITSIRTFLRKLRQAGKIEIVGTVPTPITNNPSNLYQITASEKDDEKE